VFVFRVQRPEAAGSPLVQNALRLYDLVLVPHSAGEVEVPTPDGTACEWTGPILIRDRDDSLARDEARARLGLPPDGRVLYISFGGGGDAEMDRALSLAVESLADCGAHLAVAQAPLHRGTAPRAVGTTAVTYYPMAELYSAYDAAISAAGYNSTMELMHHGVATALVPFPRQVDDQHARARLLEEAGAALCVEPLTAEQLRSAAARILNRDCAASLSAAALRQAPGNGADRAARAIVGLLP
jgi:UDP:flavonoid glycosyltransferase YjiC (YdhE family)